MEVARLLLERGADPNRRDLSGVSAFDAARRKNRAQITELLRQSGADTAGVRFPNLQGVYLGQSPPGDEPTLFAPGIVACHLFEHGSPAVSPMGDEIYWTGSVMPSDSGYTRGKIFWSRRLPSGWTQPELAPFGVDLSYGDDVPCFQPDGRRLYFLSNRPSVPGGRLTGERLWCIDLDDAGTVEPRLLADAVGGLDIHWQFSVPRDGTIYFGATDADGLGMGDIYVTRMVEGAYAAPENLGAPVNSAHSEGSPFVTPDESMLLFASSRRDDSMGGSDLYVSFRDRQGRWTRPRNLGPPANSPENDHCPRLSPDGKYLFFISHREDNSDAYWMSARFLERLRP